MLREERCDMANQEQLSILKQGVEVWNQWRHENPDVEIDLTDADLGKAKLAGINLSRVRLRRVNFYKADLSKANLSRANLRKANLFEANLMEADLSNSSLRDANLGETNLSKANLSEATLDEAELRRANLENADLTGASLIETRIGFANLKGANLSGANLSHANLNQTNLSEANLCNTNLTQANLVSTRINKAKISGSTVYGINVWDLDGEFEEQEDLIVTRMGQPIVTVDDIKVAQFIYLILNNESIRDVINTLTSKSVLILGRFGIAERKAILDGLRSKLRVYDLLPIVFDFDRPNDRDFTETIKTLAGMSYFVIADVTNPKSSPLELQATVPDYQIPFVPIIHEGESPFAMMVDLQKKYDWVLDTISYDSLDTLIEILKPLIIDPAIKMCDKLRIIKAAQPTIISGREWKEKKG
jgi:uncharacterized protein YjbI with pentapeptide repeats